MRNIILLLPVIVYISSTIYNGYSEAKSVEISKSKENNFDIPLSAFDVINGAHRSHQSPREDRQMFSTMINAVVNFFKFSNNIILNFFQSILDFIFGLMGSSSITLAPGDNNTISPKTVILIVSENLTSTPHVTIPSTEAVTEPVTQEKTTTESEVTTNPITTFDPSSELFAIVMDSFKKYAELYEQDVPDEKEQHLKDVMTKQLEAYFSKNFRTRETLK